jgi:4-methyl-5(b-hydroxyethyl)-thiazole monophosphate biosynthesis
MKKVACLLAEGFEETEAIQTVDILRRAHVHVDLISIKDKIVIGSHKIQVIADLIMGDSLDEYDMILLPGGQPGTDNLKNDDRVISAIQKFDENKKWLAAICAAPIVLDKANVLNGKKVTSHPSVIEGHFEQSNYLNKEVVLDGHIITSRGVGTSPAFAFTILELFNIDSQPFKEAMMFNHK